MSEIVGDQSSRSLKYKMFIFNYSTTSLKQFLDIIVSLLLGLYFLFWGSNEYLLGEAAEIENERCNVCKNNPVNEGKKWSWEVIRHKLIEEWEHFY